MLAQHLQAQHLHRCTPGKSRPQGVVASPQASPVAPDKASESNPREQLTSDPGPIVSFVLLVVVYTLTATWAFVPEFWNDAAQQVDQVMERVVYHSVRGI